MTKEEIKSIGGTNIYPAYFQMRSTGKLIHGKESVNPIYNPTFDNQFVFQANDGFQLFLKLKGFELPAQISERQYNNIRRLRDAPVARQTYLDIRKLRYGW